MFHISKKKDGNLISYIKKHWFKVLFMLVYFIFFILYLFDLWNDFLPGTMDTLISTVTLIVAASIFFYNEINFIFIFFNKTKIAFKNPTVFWKATTTIYSDDNNKYFKDRNRDFVSTLREKSEIKNFNIDHDDESLFKLTIINHREMNIFIYKEYANDITEDYNITFKYSSSMSYRDSKNEYEYFLSLVNIYCYPLAKQEKLEEYTDQDLEPSHTLSIEFKEYNPYHTVLMKNISSNKINSFRINFSVNGAKIDIIDNKLTVVSKDEDVIKKISNDYIAISSK